MLKEKAREKKKAYFFAGGGTAGHINPALRVADELKRNDPDAEMLFLVTKEGLEYELVSKSGHSYEIIRASAYPRKWRDWPGFIYNTLFSVLRAFRIMKKYQTKLVLGTGGYVSAAAILAAKLARVPAFLHEQNALPGRTNRLLSTFSRQIFLSFPSAEQYFPKPHKKEFAYLGNPVHPDFFTNRKETVRKALSLSESDFLIVCLGGSLGAKTINEAVVQMVKSKSWQDFITAYPQVKLLLSAGKVNKIFIREEQIESEQVRVEEFIDTSLWMPASDLLVGRAGAGFLAEAAACGKASILIPFPEAADNHQEVNAQIYADRGAALKVNDREFTGDRLFSYIYQLFHDETKRRNMEKAMMSLAKEKAAADIAAILKQTADEE